MTLVTISSTDIGVYHGTGTPAFARLYANKAFVTSESVIIAQGSKSHPAFYQEFPCSLVGTAIRIATGDAYSTVNSSAPDATYSLVIYDSSGRILADTGLPSQYSRLRIPTTTPTTWEGLRAFSAGTVLRDVPRWMDDVNLEARLALLGSQSAPLATDAIAGKGRLDTVAADPTVPIFVGANSPRVSKVLSADYGNSLVTAIASIGATPTTLVIKADTTLPSAIVVPTTLYFKPENGALITKSGSGAITFLGYGLVDPAAPIPLFSGFAAGNIVWTGTVYPKEISTELWSTGNVSLTDRVARADAAMAGKSCQLTCYPRTITESATITENHILYFSPGDYLNELNTADTTFLPAFRLHSNVIVTGTKEARIHESPHDKNVNIFYSWSTSEAGTNGSDENIHIYNLSFIGNPAGGDSTGSRALIFFCNTINSSVRNCYFYRMHGYTVFLNGYGDIGNYCMDCVVENNTFVGIATSMASVANGKNCYIRNNIFDHTTTWPEVASGNYTCIDVEPNGTVGVIENIFIEGNMFDFTGEPTDLSRFATAIAIQPGQFNGAFGVFVRGNTILGRSIVATPGSVPLVTGITSIGVQELVIEDNYIRSAYAAAIVVRNSRYAQITNNNLLGCSTSGAPFDALNLLGVGNSDISDNRFNEVFTPQTQATGIYETELEAPVTTSGSTVTNLYVVGNTLIFEWWNGSMTVTINATDYVTNAADFLAQTLTTTVAVGSLPVKTAASATDVNIGTDTITLGAHNFVNNARVKYTAGSVAIGGLTDGLTYFVTGRTPTTIQLSLTLGGAVINLTGTGTGNQSFTAILRTKFSSNTFSNNKAADGINLEPTGSSVVYSRYTDVAEIQTHKDAAGGYVGKTLEKINFWNTARTFLSFFTNANTAARTYTLQDRNGTIADDTDLALKANIASPTFTGNPAAPTPTVGDNDTSLATTAFVQAAIGSKTYAANFTQSSTTAPVPTLFLNQLSAAIVWAYTSTGLYTGTLAGAFLTGKVPTQIGIIIAGGGTLAATGTWRITRTSDNTITLETFAAGALTDGLLTGKFISFVVFN